MKSAAARSAANRAVAPDRLMRIRAALFVPWLMLAASGQAQTPTPAPGPLTLEVPGAPWSLTFPKGAFQAQPSKLSPDGKKGYLTGTDGAGLTVSFFVEPAEKCKSSRECRDMVQKLGFARLENAERITASDIGEISVVECFVPEFKGQPVKQQHLFAEFVVQGFWVDMHISKALFTPADREQLVQLVKSVAFVPKERTR